MVEKTPEDLSCLTDDELGSSESLFLLRRLEHDAELRARWTRYHAIGEVMRGGSSCLRVDLSARITEALENEPAPVTEIAPVRRWQRPLAGAAVAATVAFGVFNWAQLNDPTGLPDDQLAAEAVNPGLSQPIAAEEPTPLPLFETPPMETVSDSQSNAIWADPRLQSYVVQHNEFSSGRRSTVIAPHILLVTTPAEDETDEQEQATARPQP